MSEIVERLAVELCRAYISRSSMAIPTGHRIVAAATSAGMRVNRLLGRAEPMTEQLWAAVDAITKPTSMRVWRDDEVDERSLIADYASRRFGVCDVASYRASTARHGKIPSLWDQAEQALYKTGETQDGNRSPLETRSPADMALMETMLTLRELVAEFFADQDKPIPTSPVLPAELRHMASEILRRNADVDLWTYRIEQLRRLLENHLQAIDRGPKPMRLRVRCSSCFAEHITIPDPEGNLGKDGNVLKLVVRPILAVYRDRMLRHLECQACLRTEFAGEAVLKWAEEIQADQERIAEDRRERRALEAERMVIAEIQDDEASRNQPQEMTG